MGSVKSSIHELNRRTPLNVDRRRPNVSMVKSVEIDVAQSSLSEIIAGLKPGDEVVIVQNHKPIAKLIPPPITRVPRVPGSCQGMITIISEDDDHLRDFEEALP